MELKEASVGDIVNFTYSQPFTGNQTRHLAKVIGIRKLKAEEIAEIARKSNYRMFDSEFKRTETLVTCTLPGGICRNFYAERSDECFKPIMAGIMYMIKDMIARLGR